jgi:hypothetical protein
MKLLNTVASATPKFLGALSLVAGLSFSMGAQASVPVIDLGTLAVGETTYRSLEEGRFSDNFTFKLAQDSVLGETTRNLRFSIFGVDMLNIKKLSFEMFSDAAHKHSLGSGLNSVFTLASGNYFANVSGKANGALLDLGKYELKFNVANSIPAVPEVETYAMLLAGLGVIGVISRRRQKTATAMFA